MYKLLPVTGEFMDLMPKVMESGSWRVEAFVEAGANIKTDQNENE